MIGRHAMGCPTSVGLHAVTVSVSTATTTQRTAMTESLNFPTKSKDKNHEVFDKWVKSDVIPRLQDVFQTYGRKNISASVLFGQVAQAVFSAMQAVDSSAFFDLVAEPSYMKRGSDAQFRCRLIVFYILGCMVRDEDAKIDYTWIFQHNFSESEAGKFVLGKLGKECSENPDLFKRMNMSFFQRLASKPANAFMLSFYECITKKLNKTIEESKSLSDIFNTRGPTTSLLEDFVFGPKDEYKMYAADDFGYAYTTLRWLCAFKLGGYASPGTIAVTKINCDGQDVILMEQLLSAAPLAKDFPEGGPDYFRVFCPTWRTLGEFFKGAHITSTWCEEKQPSERYRTLYFCFAILFLACEHENNDKAYDNEVLERMSFIEPLIVCVKQVLSRDLKGVKLLQLRNKLTYECVARRYEAFFGNESVETGFLRAV